MQQIMQEKTSGKNTHLDLVVSDMAHNLTGIASADTAQMQYLIELAVDFSLQHLQPKGALVVKAFHGSGFSQLIHLFKQHFVLVKEVKPAASRPESSETFIIGKGLKINQKKEI
jgi:23S rRNA (uridine2552-2'-O)-methyltransferase